MESSMGPYRVSRTLLPGSASSEHGKTEEKKPKMILLDTNIVIYLHGAQLDDEIAHMLRNSTLDTCNIIVAEVLGYKFIDPKDTKYFEDLFATMKNHLFNKEVTSKVIELRQTTNIKLPDAIIASTALINDLALWTHNTEDFKKVPKLQLFDPIST
jgi:predicted nucleic acid-binding protein